MRKLFTTITFLITILFFQFCSSPKNIAAPVPVAITYQNNILPIVQTSCAPCHIAGKGNKLALDNYAGTREVVDDILMRIQKSPGERGFMPARHSRLSDSTIAIFADWKTSGLLEK